MAVRMRAAPLREAEKPLRIDEAERPQPCAGDVLADVKIASSRYQRDVQRHIVESSAAAPHAFNAAQQFH